MGCDIHMYVELKKSFDDKERWINFDHFRLNPDVPPEQAEYEHVSLWDNRYYLAFAQLCGVKAWHPSIPKIAEPRGVPADICDFVKKKRDESLEWSHSHSVVTLQELRDFALNLPSYQLCGLVPADIAEKLDKKRISAPDTWLRGTSLPGYVQREWSSRVNALEPIQKALEARAQEYWLSEKAVLAKNIRIVFWFSD